MPVVLPIEGDYCENVSRGGQFELPALGYARSFQSPRLDFPKLRSLNPAMKRILVVDDDRHIAEVISFALEQAGYVHVVAEDGGQGLKAFEDFRPDLVILDVGLPEMDGLEVCRRIRRTSDVPILFLSARSDEIDRILGLEIGGDDYVTKPFSPRELMARVSVILKRMGAPDREPAGNGIKNHGALTFNEDERSVHLGDHPIGLTKIEFGILKTLIARPRMVFSRDQILEDAYPHNIHVSDRTIDSHIRNLRAKFSRHGCTDLIETVHGTGFKMGACSRGAGE